MLWRALGDAGLLTLTTPESHDGAGLGFVELCRVLVEVGRTVAPVPLATDAVARLFLGEHGSDDQQRIGVRGRHPELRDRRGARARSHRSDDDRGLRTTGSSC